MSFTGNYNFGTQPIESGGDYGIESDDGVTGLVPYGFHSDSDDSYELPTKTKTRKKRVQVENAAWFSAKNRMRRENGKSYFGRVKDNNVWNYEKTKESRNMKGRCRCKKDGAMKCAEINDDDRKNIFKEFWKMNWEEKKVYVNTLIESAPINRPRNRKLLSESKRSLTLKYYLKVQGKNMRVCRKFFLNTLDVGAKVVLNWSKKYSVSETVSKKIIQKNVGT